MKKIKKKSFNLEQIRELHRQGQRDAAKKGYLALLKINPRHVDALHGLGILYTQEENFEQATKTLQQALQYQPNDPTLALHLANVLKIQGHYLQAIVLLDKIIQSHPSYAPAYNNLGTILYAQEKWDEAIDHFNLSIDIEPQYTDAYYNLGLAYAKKLDFTNAINSYQRLLDQVPDHFPARYLLASTLMQQNNLPAATNEFLKIEAAHPYHFETQCNIATCYLKQGALNEAKIHYIKAHELRPEDTQILYNLGVINMQQGNVDDAIQYYQRACHIDPDSFAIQNNLGVAFLAKQHKGYALQHFKEAARLQPQNKSIAYVVTMLTKDQPLITAPADYVVSLFDAYADHYDSHLLKALEYQIPELFLNTLKPNLSSNSLDILDIGCGTGLCGTPFKPFAKTLVGIDLSSKMIAMAAQKNSYDHLVTSDLMTFLTDKKEAYDLILAGDVLVYIGDLDAIFTWIHQALRHQGLFVFNTEIEEAQDFKMNQSGRFAHHKDYLERLAQTHHFQIISAQTVITRMQNNEPVQGYLYVIRK